MAELVDAPGLGPGGETCGGSSPPARTIEEHMSAAGRREELDIVEVNVERIGPVEVRLNFEISAAECDRELNNAYKAYASRVRLPGFRPGKVPVRRIKKQIQKQVVHEVSEVIIDRAYREAIRQEELRPVLAPNVEGRPYCHEGQPFNFVMTVEVRPDIELKKIQGFDVSVDLRVIEDADVESELKHLQLSKAEYADAEEGAEATAEHRVRVSFDAKHGDKDVASGEERTFFLGDDNLEEAILKALLGAKVGDEVETDITFSEDNANPDLAGETVHHTFKVLQLETATLPALDDELAKGFEMDDLDALRAAVRERMETMAKQHQERQMEDQVIDALVDANPFEVPPGLVQMQLERSLQRAMPGMTPDKIAEMGINLDDFREEMRPQAMRAVQVGLLLDEIAEAEDLSPGPQEVAQEMVQIAQSSGQPLAQVQQQLRKPEVMEQIVSELRNRKALAFVVDAAKGKDEEGAEEA